MHYLPPPRRRPADVGVLAGLRPPLLRLPSPTGRCRGGRRAFHVQQRRCLLYCAVRLFTPHAHAHYPLPTAMRVRMPTSRPTITRIPTLTPVPVPAPPKTTRIRIPMRTHVHAHALIRTPMRTHAQARNRCRLRPVRGAVRRAQSATPMVPGARASGGTMHMACAKSASHPHAKHKY